MGHEDVVAPQYDVVQYADKPDMTSGTGRVDCLHHRFLGPYRLDDRMRAESVGELLDPGRSGVASFGDDVGCAEVERELLSRLVAAHRDDALRAELLGGQDGEEADRAVTDDRDGLAGTGFGCDRTEPACAKDVGGGQEAGYEIIAGYA